jgi:hypothetical protein
LSKEDIIKKSIRRVLGATAATIFGTGVLMIPAAHATTTAQKTATIKYHTGATAAKAKVTTPMRISTMHAATTHVKITGLTLGATDAKATTRTGMHTTINASTMTATITHSGTTATAARDGTAILSGHKSTTLSITETRGAYNDTTQTTATATSRGAPRAVATMYNATDATAIRGAPQVLSTSKTTAQPAQINATTSPSTSTTGRLGFAAFSALILIAFGGTAHASLRRRTAPASSFLGDAATSGVIKAPLGRGLSFG